MKPLPPASIALLLCAASSVAAAESPVFDDSFWQHWGDGRAELAGYDLTFPRYGETRSGTAVTIFVTETFSDELRVKADPGRHPASDEFPVMKLNLVEDFSTGIYDYNLMTSTFVALTGVGDLPAGSTTKVSFSSQEWCGHVYQQMLFDADRVRFVAHSYFDGEADQRRELAGQPEGLAADALLVWARGLAYPRVEAGQQQTVPLLKSSHTVRLAHEPIAWQRATLARSAAITTVEVPAGTFEVRSCTAAIEDGPTWTFDVEAAWPHRVIQWQNDRGERARLLGVERLKYWELNGPGGEEFLAELGLSPRTARMP